MNRLEKAKLAWHRLALLTRVEMASRYRGTLAGVVWVMAYPVTLFFAHYLVFGHTLGFHSPTYPLYLLSGLLPWFCLILCLNTTGTLYTAWREPLRSLPIDPRLPVAAKVLDTYFNFLLVFILLVGFFGFKSGLSTSRWLAMSLPLGVFLLGLLAMARLIALLQVFFRDAFFIVQFLNGILYLITPILYPPEMASPWYAWTIAINPYYAFIEPFQHCAQGTLGVPFVVALLKGLGFAVFFHAVAEFLWRRNELRFYHVL